MKGLQSNDLIARILRYRIAYLWFAPFLILFVIFWAWPIFFSFNLSLHKWEMLGKPTFVGLRNFRYLFKDEYFWTSFYNTLYYFLAIVPLRTFLALVIAFVLNSPQVRWKEGFRIVYVLPYMTAPIYVALLFKVLMAEGGGWINVFLEQAFGIQPVPWLVSPAWSKISVSTVVYWNGFGFYMLILLGGLQKIPKDLYEAAAIDGANQVQCFFRITVPLMLPIIAFIMIISTIEIFSLFEAPLLLTEGGPGVSSITLTLQLWRNAFDYFKMGYASTYAVVIFLAVVFLSALQLKWFKSK